MNLSSGNVTRLDAYFLWSLSLEHPWEEKFSRLKNFVRWICAVKFADSPGRQGPSRCAPKTVTDRRVCDFVLTIVPPAKCRRSLLLISTCQWLRVRPAPGADEKHPLCPHRPDFLDMSESLQQIANMSRWHAEKQRAMICTQEQPWSAECKSPFGSSDRKGCPPPPPPRSKEQHKLEAPMWWFLIFYIFFKSCCIHSREINSLVLLIRPVWLYMKSNEGAPLFKIK